VFELADSVVFMRHLWYTSLHKVFSDQNL
jgi:hypothetical protein